MGHGFEFEGAPYGGDNRPESDERVLKFVDRVRRHAGLISESPEKKALRILECGCLAGGHIAMLARAFPEGESVATDVRDDNLRKARFFLTLRQLSNVAFVREDLDEPQSLFAQPYDAVFCVGLLYHLRTPAEFLALAGRSTSFLWLWTVVCAEEEAVVSERGYRGRMLPESPSHPLSRVQRESFLPTIGSLADMLWAAGFETLEFLKKEMTSNGNGPAILLCASRSARASSPDRS